MSVTCGFYNSLNGDRKYNSIQISSIFNGIIKDGIFQSIGTSMMVTAQTGMTVGVGVGRSWFNNTWTYNDSTLPIAVDSSDIILDRIDTIVLEIDGSEYGRNNTIKYIKGTPASNPSRPTLTNTTDVHQYPLCYISVKKGVTSITSADITNMVGTTDCPFITGVLQTITTDALIVQWAAQFNEWFDGMKDQLSTDAAGHLQTEIDAVQNEINDIVLGNTEIGRALYAKNGNRSLDVIDGNFQVASNGAAKDTQYQPTSNYPIWDCWNAYGMDAGMTVAWVSTSGQVPGSNYCAQLTWNALMSSGTGFNNYILSRIEQGVSFLCSYPKLTVSFWARGNFSGAKICVKLSQSYGTGGSPSALESTASSTVVLSDTWKRYSVTITPLPISGKTFGTNNDDTLGVIFGIDASLNNQNFGYIQLTQVQLDVGIVSLPYRTKSYDEELRLCRRYYEVYAASLLVSGSSAFYRSETANFLIPKRIVPVVTLWGAWSQYFAADYAFAMSSIPNKTGFYAKTASATAPVNVLNCGYTADARF